MQQARRVSPHHYCNSVILKIPLSSVTAPLGPIPSFQARDLSQRKKKKKKILGYTSVDL
jgi:hypothetical protein